MLFPILIGVVGLALLAFGFWRFGVQQIQSNVFSKGGAVLLTGLALMTTAGIYGGIKYQQIQDRSVFETKLAELLHRAPERLELEGDSLDDFHGVAYLDGKTYQVKSKWAGANDKGRKYEVIAEQVGGK